MKPKLNPQEDTVAQILTVLAEYYGKVLTDTQLKLYVEDLLDIEPRDLVKAVRLYKQDQRNTSHNFLPPTAKIRAILKPSDDHQAREVVSRIIHALTNYRDPYCHSDERTTRAKEYIGELGWMVVQRMGGWFHLSNADEDAIGPMAQAQWRELANSIQTRNRLGVMDQAPQLPSSEGKPLRISEKPPLEEKKEEPRVPLNLFKPVVTLDIKLEEAFESIM